MTSLCVPSLAQSPSFQLFQNSKLVLQVARKMRFWLAVPETAVVASTWLSMVASATTPTRDLSIAPILSTNTSASFTIPITPIDPRFHITGLVTPHPPLTQNSLLMTAVNEMAKLALLDWNGRVGSFRSTRIPGYSDISISIKVTPPAQQLDTKVAVWGFYAAIDSMRFGGGFTASAFNLYWDGSKVGILRFKQITTLEPATGGQRNKSEDLDLMLPTLPSIADSFRNLTDESAILKADGFTPDCIYIRDAQPLTFEEVLYPLITTLRDVAPVPKDSFLDEKFLVQPVGLDAQIAFGGRRYGPISRHNTYQYKWVVKTLQAIPIFFLRNNRFAEMLVHLIVNGDYVGVGGLDKRGDLADVMSSTS